MTCHACSKLVKKDNVCSNCGKHLRVKVEIIESERGWGQKVDEVKWFDTETEANTFIRKFNAQNNKAEVPDWYMYARLG